MGLFGYNKRDFEKNTEKFKKRIENIVTLVSDLTYNFMGKKRGSLMKYLSMCMEDLTIITYNEYGSDYKMIDKEINNILGNIEEALSKKEGGSAVGYAELLRDEISCCRRYGKNVFSDTDRKNKLRKIEIILRLSDIAEKREAIANRKNEIIELVLKSSEEMIEKYGVEYDALCSEEENLAEQFRQYQELYKTHIDYMNALGNKKFADEINPDVLFGKVEDLKKELEELEASRSYRPSGFETLVDARANKGEATPKNEEVKCAYCGTTNNADQKYCQKCGQALKK